MRGEEGGEEREVELVEPPIQLSQREMLEGLGVARCGHKKFGDVLREAPHAHHKSANPRSVSLESIQLLHSKLPCQQLAGLDSSEDRIASGTNYSQLDKAHLGVGDRNTIHPPATRA